MVRALSLVLMLLQLAPLGALAHFHREAGETEPPDHAARPHFHVGRHGHRHHHGPSHRTTGVRIDGSAEHDADAVYVADIPVSTGGAPHESARTLSRSAADGQECPSYGAGLLTRSLIDCGGASLGPAADTPPVAAARCPVYLRTLSIRC